MPVEFSINTLARCIMLLAPAALGHDHQIKIGAEHLDTLQHVLNSASATA